MCPHTTLCVRILRDVSSYYYICMLYMCACFYYICMQAIKGRNAAFQEAPLRMLTYADVC